MSIFVSNAVSNRTEFLSIFILEKPCSRPKIKFVNDAIRVSIEYEMNMNMNMCHFIIKHCYCPSIAYNHQGC